MRGRKKRAILALLLAVFVLGAAMTIRQRMQYQKIAAEADEAAEIAGRREPAVRAEAPVQPEAPQEPEPPSPPEEAAALADIDLEALRAVNEDVVGWIEIPGTDLSYPLVRGTDNQYYLSHNWKGEESSGGAIFLECVNSPDLTGFHTIAYGHRMRNGSMFGMLRHYKEPDFYREHPSVYVALENGVYRYDIFSAREAGVKGIVYRLDLEESGLAGEFLQSCVEDSALDTGIVPEPEDRILTLSTCTGAGYAARWVVHGVLAEVYRPEG